MMFSRRAVIAAMPLALAACKPQTVLPVEARIPTEGRTAKFLAAAHDQTRRPCAYDGGYAKMGYPGGDIALERGACSDVLIRAYRAIGIDLQKLVHEDMVANFRLYPQKWGLKGPDSNIDHRRVPNLMAFFSRFGQVLPLSHDPADYRPGDILANAPVSTHIAVVSDVLAPFGGKRLMVIQNVGFGVNVDDALFSYRLLGHYRYGL